MTEKQRIIVLGDIHYCEQDKASWDRAVADINALSPSLILAVGDLTGGSVTGTPEGMALAVDVLNRFDAPWQSVIGNHDLQAEEFATDEAAVASFLGFMHRDTPWFRMDHGPLTVIGLSNTKWRRNPVNKNEIVFEDDQLEWCRAELASIPGRPVLILAHVPPVGSGLMAMAELHASVGNAFANQNHYPSMVTRLVREFPNVLMWFSGHNHLGQHYRDAISVRLGVHFVHAGVVGRQSRDGYHHSRVIDIAPDSLTISTFDHGYRRIDAALTYHEPHGLDTLIDYRKSIHMKRLVATDPATMRQGPGPLARRSNQRRFAFLSDSHITGRVSACQQRLFEWSVRQARGNCVDEWIFGGDMTHHASAEEACRAIELCGCEDTGVLYLPGNNETIEIEPEKRFPKIRYVRKLLRLQDWPGYAFALATTNQDDAGASVEALADQLPDKGAVLVLAHFPPLLAGEDAVARLNKPGVAIDWVCGHQHCRDTRQESNIRVHVCGGLDPVKVRSHSPEMLIADWDGQALSVQRLLVPEPILLPHGGQKFPLGLAYRGDIIDLIKTALEHQVTAVQVSYGAISGPISQQEKEWIQRFRDETGDSFLSVHLPNFASPADGVKLESMEPYLQWAEAAGVDDLTLHTPKVPVHMLFVREGQLAESPWAKGCIEAFTQLARRAIRMGAGLSIENMYSKESPAGDMDELLSIRPWHLLHLVKAIREQLRATGKPEGEVRKVGVIFDTGHAFRGAKINKIHGLADWLDQLQDYLQLAHIHQVFKTGEGKITNHVAISDIHGPQINYSGLLAILAETVQRPFPLLLEIRDRDQALQSLHALRRHACITR